MHNPLSHKFFLLALQSINKNKEMQKGRFLYNISCVTFFSFKMEKTNCKSFVYNIFAIIFKYFCKSSTRHFFLFSVVGLGLLFGIPGFEYRFSTLMMANLLISEMKTSIRAIKGECLKQWMSV